MAASSQHRHHAGCPSSCCTHLGLLTCSMICLASSRASFEVANSVCPGKATLIMVSSTN